VSFNRFDDFVDAFPLIGVLGLSIDDLEALKDVDNVINPSPFHSQLPRALIEVEERAEFAPVYTEEASAEFSQTFLFTTIL
jgi:hypothetical protein